MRKPCDMNGPALFGGR